MNTVAEIIKKGGIGVYPTDTIYGLIGSALSESVVERLYNIKGRDEDKPFIILISDIKELGQFSAVLSPELERIMKTYWPGPLTIILKTNGDTYTYLHRGKGPLAFRLPEKKELRELIKEVGPLVAPSANTQGDEPARNIEEARSYFGGSVDFYVDGGEIQGHSSTIVDATSEPYKIIREGSVKLDL